MNLNFLTIEFCSLTIMLTDEEMPILVDIHLEVKGVRRVDVNTYTDLQTGTETPDYTVRKCSVSYTGVS